MTSVAVSPADGDTDYWGTLASEMQSNVSVAGKAITGTLTKLTSGSLVDVWGEGYFIALKFDDFTEGLTYADVKVGLAPTEGAGLVTLDADQDGVFKITDKDTQKLMIWQKKDGVGSLTEFYDLSGLTLE